MSHYIAEVGIVKIKEEYLEEFGYFFNEEYEEVHSPIFLELLKEFPDGPTRAFKWEHDNVKPSWIGKYKTSYENGIFTYGVYYNESGDGWMYWCGWYDVLYEIGIFEFRDIWEEPG